MLKQLITSFLQKNNFVNKSEAIDQSMVGLEIFDEPIMGYANPEDNLFYEYRDNPQITYNNFIPPLDWLPEAKTVISIFFPYTQNVKRGNSLDMKYPSKEWLHARIEGQEIINNCTRFLISSLNGSGYNAISPSLDSNFRASVGTWLDTNEKLTNSHYYSNWSERHVAFAAGLGTFGLSKGLITSKGITGRFSSIVTDWRHIISERHYSDIYEYCNLCGKCISNCPVNAISFEHGKNHTKCSRFIDFTEKKSAPRYGCGKCQVNVPCANRIPKK